MPVDPPTREHIESWWLGILECRTSREDAHDWAEPLMFAEYSTTPDAMVMSALQYLHGFDLTFSPPDRNLVRHGPPGEYLKTLDDVRGDFERWQADCVAYDRDPDGFSARQRVATRRHAVEEFAAALDGPLDATDVADGWSEEARVACAVAIGRVLADLDNGWGEDADYASHHLVRALDHWGIGAWSTGHLARSAEAAQAALIRLRPIAQNDGVASL